MHKIKYCALITLHFNQFQLDRDRQRVQELFAKVLRPVQVVLHLIIRTVLRLHVFFDGRNSGAFGQCADCAIVQGGVLRVAFIHYMRNRLSLAVSQFDAEHACSPDNPVSQAR